MPELLEKISALKRDHLSLQKLNFCPPGSGIRIENPDTDPWTPIESESGYGSGSTALLSRVQLSSGGCRGQNVDLF
jgi:hypothetical protein